MVKHGLVFNSFILSGFGGAVSRPFFKIEKNVKV
mgnify:CR=1 FL=1